MEHGLDAVEDGLEGVAAEVFRDPRHPYTVGLLRCIPRGGVRKDETPLDTIPGFLPQLGAEIQGCVFAPRCGLARDICREEEPPLRPIGDSLHLSACHFAEELEGQVSKLLEEPAAEGVS